MKNTLLTVFLLASALKAQTSAQPAAIGVANPKMCGTYREASDVPVDSFVWDVFTDDQSAGGVGVAIAVRWLDRHSGSLIVHTALNTLDGCLVSDLDLVDGKRILQILPDWLTSRVKYGVAFEAIYAEGNDRKSRRHRGVFVMPQEPGERGFFLFELDESKLRIVDGRRVDTEPDFTLTDQGFVPNVRVMMHPRLAPKVRIARLPLCPQGEFHPYPCIAPRRSKPPSARSLLWRAHPKETITANRDDILDRRMLSLSESDHLSLRDLVEGTLITGAPGSGKTTTSGKQLAYALLRTRRAGGLILTAKAEETLNWIAYAKACGREKDLIVFNAESGHCFDPLHYEWTRPGRGAGDLESVIDLFSTLVSIGKKEGVGQGHDPFWERGSESVTRNVIKLLDLAGERVSIANIDRVIKSLPTRPDQHEEAAWQEQSYCAQLIKAIKARKESLTPDLWSDLDFATQFVFRKWPGFDERPRSSLEMTWSGMADKFLFNPFNRLFCGGKCTFSPQMTTHEGKIIICDFPLLEYGHETGRLINVILKLIFQRAWLRRQLSESPNPVFLWQDEFQYFVTRRDNFFQQTCRGSRVAVVCLTQNILNLSEELGEGQPGSKTKSFCGNLAIKIAHQQNEPDTATFMADIIGKEYRYMESYNAGGGNAGNSHASVGGTQHLAHIVEPIEFSRLAKPDAVNPCSEAIVYQSGKPFNASKTERNPKGRNYLRVMFSRDI